MGETEASDNLLLFVGQAQPKIAPPAVDASSDAPLVEAAQRGDSEAFGQLYSHYAPMVHGILLTRVPYGEVADLVQDVFMLALKKIHTLREAAAFGPWLAVITRNRAMDFYRRSQQTEELSEDMARQSPSGAEALEILEVIRDLPEAYRETLILRLVEGMTGPEIATRMWLSHASVRVNLHRGMKLLRQKLVGKCL